MASTCFGKYWEGVKGSPCKDGEGCNDFNECLARFATVELVKHQNELGPKATPEELAAFAGVSPESILLAMNFQKNAGILTKPSNEESSESGESPSPPEERSSEEEIEKSEPEEEEPVELESEPEEEKPPEEPQKPRRWDPKYNESRWKREREKSPKIAKLLPGMKLPFRYKNRITKLVVEGTVIVHYGYYTYNEEKYPTLQSVANVITGTKPYPKQKKKDGSRPEGTRQMSTYSAARLFRLDKLFGIKPKSKKGKK